MRVYYTDQPFPEIDGHSIFLAGPSPRSIDIQSWRPTALNILEELNYDGQVFVPEWNDKAILANQKEFNYLTQVEWEKSGLEGSSAIVFWVPRNLETMPAFTTNIEFGLYLGSGKAVYGRPDECPKNDYLDWVYRDRQKREPHNDLKMLLQEAVQTNRSFVRPLEGFGG